MHGVELPGQELFFSHTHLQRRPPPHRCTYLPELIELIWNRQIDRGKIFDVALPLDEAAGGSEATAPAALAVAVTRSPF